MIGSLRYKINIQQLSTTTDGAGDHGDTFTLPYFYLDPANGSIAMNIRYYLRILVTPSYTSTPSYTQLQKDSAYILGGNPCITFMHQMMFYRP